MNCFGSNIPIYYDYFFSNLIIIQLIKKFTNQYNIFFIPIFSLQHLNSIFNDNHQKTYKNSNLFFLILKQILIENNYKIIENNISLEKIIELIQRYW